MSEARVYAPGMPENPDNSPSDNGVVTVVSAFAPGASLVEAVRSAVGQSRVVVVDDGSPTDGSVAATLAAVEGLGARVVRLPRNSGIGAALNAGIRDALADPAASYVLTMDQDSTLPDGYVASLVSVADRARTAGIRVGSVAPEFAGGLRSNRRSELSGFVLAREPIQSGLLVPREVLEKLGLLDETLFIDGVDTEFFLRTTQEGARCLVAPGLSTGHQLGGTLTVDVLGRSIPVTVASTFRYYYQQRNLVVLLRRWARRRPGWAATAVGKHVRHVVITTVLAPGRRARLGELRAGLQDGLRGRTGRRPESRP